jgi:hypothetical protein
MGVRTKVHLWATWLQVAVRNAAAAHDARLNGYLPRADESPDSAKLSAEFQFALTAIAASAFAMEALSKELEGAGHKTDSSRFTTPPDANRGFFVGHSIVQAFGLVGPMAAALPGRLQYLFKLRNDGVHFESEWRAGVHPHPNGTCTAYELTVYTLEASVAAVQLGIDVIRECADSACDGRCDPSARDAAEEMSSVLSMLKSELRAEGL